YNTITEQIPAFPLDLSTLALDVARACYERERECSRMRHGYSDAPALTLRCQRRRMGLRRAVSDPDRRSCAAAQAPPARGLQRAAVPGPLWRAVPGYDGHKRRKGSKVHAAQVQEVTGDHVELGYGDQAYIDDEAAAAHGLQLVGVQRLE